MSAGKQGRCIFKMDKIKSIVLYFVKCVRLFCCFFVNLPSDFGAGHRTISLRCSLAFLVCDCQTDKAENVFVRKTGIGARVKKVKPCGVNQEFFTAVQPPAQVFYGISLLLYIYIYMSLFTTTNMGFLTIHDS